MSRFSGAAMGVLLVVSAACTGGDGDEVTTTSTAPSVSTTAPAPAPAEEAAEPVRVIDVSEVGSPPLAMVTDGLSLWLAGSSPRGEGGRVARVSIESGRLVWTADVPDSIVGLAVSSAGVLFATGGGDGADLTGGISRLDAESGRVLGTFEIPDGGPYGVAATPRPEDLETPQPVDRDTFRRALSDSQGTEFYGYPGAAPFRLTLEGGAVTRLEQLYRP